MNHIDQIKAYYGKTAARQDYQKAMSTFLFLKEHEAHEKGRALSKSVTLSWLAHMEKFLGRDSRQYWEAVKEALLTGYGPLKTRISPTAVVGTGYRNPKMVALDYVAYNLTGRSKYFGEKVADWEAGEKGEKKSGPGVGKGEGSDVPDGEGNTAKRAALPREYKDLTLAIMRRLPDWDAPTVNPRRSKFQKGVLTLELDLDGVDPWVEMTDPQGFIQKTTANIQKAVRGVINHSIFEVRYVGRDRWSILIPQASLPNKTASEDVSGPFRTRVTHVVTAADLYVAVSGKKLLGATDGAHGASKSGWKDVDRVRNAPSYEILKVKNVPQNVAVNMVDWGADNPKTSFWKDEETAYKAVERYLKKGEKVAAFTSKTAADIDAAYTAAIVKELKRMAGSLGITRMKQKSKGSGSASARRQIQLNFDGSTPMIDLWVGKLDYQSGGAIVWETWAAYGTVSSWYDAAKAPLTGDLRQDVRAISIALKEYVEKASRASTKTAGVLRYKGDTPLDKVYAMSDLLKEVGMGLPTGSTRSSEVSAVQKSLYKLESFVEKQTKKASLQTEPIKTAGNAGGLYGFPKALQNDCDVASRRVAKAAVRIAKAAYKKDARVAEFLSTHAKRSKSVPAKALVAALAEMGPKIASTNTERLQELRDKQASTNKEAKLAYGLYGYYDKTSRLGLNACAELRHEAGVVASNLHRRRAAKHARISEYLSTHCKKARCAYSRLILDGYPDAERRLASVTPKTVDEWIAWED